MIAGLAEGEYYVGFTSESESLDYVTQYYDGTPGGTADEEDATTVSVIGGYKTGVSAQMQPGAVIEGTVTSAATGTGVEEIEVCALTVGAGSSSAEFARCTLSEAGGKYVLDQLAAGSYDLEFEAFGEGGYLSPQYYEDSLSLSGAKPVEVEAGQTKTGIDMALQVGAQITGTVTNASIEKEPIEGLEVCIGTPSNQGVGCALTNKSGVYDVTGLPSGQYKVEFTGKVCESGSTCKAVYNHQFYNDKTTLITAELVSLTAPNVLGGIDASLLETSPVKPTNEDPPSLAGTGSVGSTLTCSQGVWGGNPTSLGYAWLLNGTPIAGQTESTFTIQTADEGGTIACEVTVSNAAGTTATASVGLQIPAKPIVVPPKGVASLVGKPTVKSGKVALRLRCSGSTTCQGTLTLLSKLKTRVHVEHKGKRIVKHVTTTTKFGSAKFSIAPGVEKTIAVKLTAKGTSLLTKEGARGVKLQLSGSDLQTGTFVLHGRSHKKGKAKGKATTHGRLRWSPSRRPATLVRGWRRLQLAGS